MNKIKNTWFITLNFKQRYKFDKFMIMISVFYSSKEIENI